MSATEMTLKDGQVLPPDITRLMRQIDKLKAEQQLQERVIDLHAGKRAGEKELTRDAKAYAAIQQTQMNQHVEERER